MNLRRVLVNLLIPLLLFAQQAAYAHAVTHLGKEPPAKERLAHSKLCDKCVSFEKVGGMASGSVPCIAALELDFAPPARIEYAFSPRTVSHFQGRAPPVFL